eukprot:19956_1
MSNNTSNNNNNKVNLRSQLMDERHPSINSTQITNLNAIDNNANSNKMQLQPLQIKSLSHLPMLPSIIQQQPSPYSLPVISNNFGLNCTPPVPFSTGYPLSFPIPMTSPAVLPGIVPIGAGAAAA